MKSIYILLTIFNSLICCEKCPKIQSIINLSPSGLYFNYSLVVIAKGQYYLIEGKKATEPPGQPKLPVEPSGDMPPGFEDSTINVVVDGLGCARVHYSLLTIKVLTIEKTLLSFSRTIVFSLTLFCRSHSRPQTKAGKHFIRLWICWIGRQTPNGHNQWMHQSIQC